MNCEILRHEKRTAETALFSHLSLMHYFFTDYPYANTETLILSRKLPSGFRDNTGSFRVCIWVLPASIDFYVIVWSFAYEYILAGKTTPEQRFAPSPM